LIYDWCFCDYGLVRSDLVLLYAIKKLTCGKDLGRVLDLRWLKPLNVDAVAQHAGQCKRILVLDEGRPDGGIGEGIVTALVERGLAGRPIRRITGKDCYIPLGDAAKLMLPDEAEVRQRIVAADGLILVTPEYNGAMPGYSRMRSTG